MLQAIMSQDTSISVVGLGYVGLPLAVAFAEKGVRVIGFDVNEDKLNHYRAGIDVTGEVGAERLAKAHNLVFTSDPSALVQARFHIVAVPTPVGSDKIPDLGPVKGATRIVGENLTAGSCVVFESTVYPGTTEELCVPILEECSGLTFKKDFAVGYSPERINPGDQVHRVETIVKVVSGHDPSTLDLVASIYEIIIKAGVYRASSIKVAEAAKVIENSQRDINIAFMNELAMIFDLMGIDTLEVLEAAGSKWNFLPFRPGLVGGHCIGVDPYYLTYKAQSLGYHPQIILSGRRINDDMGKYLAAKMVKLLISAGVNVKGARIGVLGLTFKENCPDLRNSKVVDVINELNEFGIQVQVHDPMANPTEALSEYGLTLTPFDDLHTLDGLILAVAHDYYAHLPVARLKALFNLENESSVVMDVKSMLTPSDWTDRKHILWRL